MAVVDIEIVTPTDIESLSSEPEPGISIHRVAKDIGKLMCGLEISRVSVLSATVAERRSMPKRARVLTCFRPYDIAKWNSRLDFTHILLLVHDQDKANWKWKIDNLLRTRKVAVVTKDAETFLSNRKVPTSQVIQIPIGDIPQEINNEMLTEMYNDIDKPRICLWIAPHIRKNSLEGLCATLDAISEYKEKCNLDIICANTFNEEVRKYIHSYLDCLPAINNVSISVTAMPSEYEKNRILANATTIVMPSFDEGFNIPAYEAGRYRPDLVVVNCGANKSLRSSILNVNFVTTKDAYIVGSEMDEFPMEVHRVKVPNYKKMVTIIYRSIGKWKNTRRRKLVSVKGKSIQVMPYDIPKLDRWIQFLDISKRRSPGGATLEII